MICITEWSKRQGWGAPQEKGGGSAGFGPLQSGGLSIFVPLKAWEKMVTRTRKWQCSNITYFSIPMITKSDKVIHLVIVELRGVCHVYFLPFLGVG